MIGTIHRFVLFGVTLLAVAAAGAPVEKESTARTTPFRYSSDDGAFQVTWPSGCGKLHERSNDPVYYEDEERVYDAVLVRAVSCDRFDLEGEGCSVAAIFNVRSPSGEEAGTAEVIEQVKKMLKKYGANIKQQSSIRREFPDGTVVEGIDVIGMGVNGIGRIWVRGLLSYHDIYVLSAWSVTEDVWTNPEYQEFFNDFAPTAK